MDEIEFIPGQRVSVPWGLDVVDGTVVSVSGEGPNRRVVVRVTPSEPDDETESLIMTFRARDLEGAATEANEHRPGSWLFAKEYEDRLRIALRQLLDQLPAAPSSTSQPNLVEDAGEGDFVLKAAGRRLLVEAKALRGRELQPDMLEKFWRQVVKYQSPQALLVTNANLSKNAQQRLRELHDSGVDLRIVRWFSSEDNDALGEAIGRILVS